MKHPQLRHVACLLLLVFCLEFVAGCHASTAGSGKSDAVTPQQKAAYNERKRQAEYDQTGR